MSMKAAGADPGRAGWGKHETLRSAEKPMLALVRPTSSPTDITNSLNDKQALKRSYKMFSPSLSVLRLAQVISYVTDAYSL